MKKLTKKLTALAVAMAVIVTAAIPALAGDTAFSYTKEINQYASPDGTAYAHVYINGLNDKQTVKKSTVTTSNKSIINLQNVENSSSTYKYVYFDQKIDPYEYGYRSAEIYAKVLKPGSATISFKVGTKTYKTKVKVLKYVNPVASFTISGYNGGKSLHKVFNTTTYASGEAPKKAVSSAKVTVKAKTGWAVRSVTVDSDANMKTKSIGGLGKYDSTTGEYVYKNFASISIPGNKLSKTARLYVGMTLVNKSNGGTIHLSYSIN